MKILLAEDIPDHRELIADALTEYDNSWQVDAVPSVQEALLR